MFEVWTLNSTEKGVKPGKGGQWCRTLTLENPYKIRQERRHTTEDNDSKPSNRV